MAEPTAYRSQVAPGGPQRAVLTRPEDFGAGLADAVGRGGEQLHSIQLRQYKLDRQEQADAQTAEVGRRAAEARLAMDDFVREARNSAAPGAKGHAEIVRAKLAEQKATLFEGITEDAVRQRAEAQWLDYEGRLISGEETYQEGRRIEYDVGNIRRMGEVSQNLIVRSGGDKAVYEQELFHSYAAIDGLNVNADLKEALKREKEQEYTISWLNARTATDPASVKLELAAGSYDEFLLPEQIAAINRGADTEIKAQAIEVEEQAKARRIKARNALEAVEAEYERGNHVDFKAVLEEARAAGIESADLIRFTTKLEDAKVLRAYNAANDPDGARSAATVAAIDDKIRAGTATPEEYRLRDRLAGYADARAVDVGQQLSEMAGQGVGGQQAALAEIDKMPVGVRWQAAEQLGDNMGYVATAKPQTRGAILSGLADIKANKDLVDAKAFREAYRKSLGPAAKGMSEQAIEGRMQVAMGYYAHYAKAQGLKADAIAPGIFNAAMKVSFGAERNPKTGQWLGGVGIVREKAVRLPEGYTATLFDSRMSKMTFEKAVYRDGSKVRKADVLANYSPVFVGNTAKGNAIYHFVDANGGELKEADGRAFAMVMD